MVKRVLVIVCGLLLLSGTVFAGGKKEAAPAVDRAPGVQRIAMILIGRSDDLAWNTAAYNGIEEIKKMRNVQTTVVEEVSDADVERVLRDFASRGYDLIIAHSYNYGDATLRVARDFPDTFFLHGTAPGNGPNVANYDIPSHEGGYLVGLLAGSLSKSNRIGVVNSFDIPSMIMVSEAFKIGVKDANPNAAVNEAFVGAWDDAPGGREAAEALLDWGADFIFAMGNHTGMGAIEGTAARGVLSAGLYADQNEIAPNYVLTSVENRFEAIIDAAIRDIEAGTYAGKEYLLTMPDGAVSLAPYHALSGKVPQELKDLVEDKTRKIISGELVIPVIITSTN